VKLKRELGLPSLTLYGIGVIIGAGIYSLIGVGAGLAGGALWLAFLIAAVIAFFTSLSYMELTGIMSREAAEYHYARRAFGREAPAFLVGWIHAAANVSFAATVAIAFAGYLYPLTGIDPRIAAPALILVMGSLNYFGIRQSAFYNDLCAGISVLGLLIIAFLGLASPAAQGADASLSSLPPAGLAGIVSAVAVIFFAYIGFENIANVAEEVKDSRRTVPLAILLSLAISAVLYLLVSVASVRVAGWVALSQSSSPLALAASRSVWDLSPLLAVIALFATSNTVLIALISASRILYGISDAGSLHPVFSSIGGRGTPWFSVVLTTLAAAVVANAADIRTAAELTNFGVFLGYFAVNVCLIAIARGPPAQGKGFRGPRIAGTPVFAWLGAATTLFMLAYIGLQLWALELAIAAAGLLLLGAWRMGHSKKPSDG
jgi:APA family basic amino acid/polyamine antiporter